MLRMPPITRYQRIVVWWIESKPPTHLPDSNQQSNTSSTRFKSPLPCLEGMVMWSMLSRCRSLIPVTPDCFSSSATELIQTIWNTGVGLSALPDRHERLAATTHLLVVLACPQGDRSSPVSISGNVPIPRVPQPSSKPSIPDILGNPTC